MHALVGTASESRTGLLATVGTSSGGTITYWPPSAVEFYDLSPNDAIGRNISELLEWEQSLPDPAAPTEHQIGDAWVRHHRTATPAQWPILRTTVSLAVDSFGAPERLYCSTPAAVGVEPDGVDLPAFLGQGFELAARCNRQMVIECVSAAMAPTFGLTTRDFIGARAINQVHPDDRRVWEDAWERALSRPNEPMSIETRQRTAKGEWRTFSTEIVNRLSDRAVSAVVLNSRDITDQRAAESAARAADMTLRSVLESMGRGIWVIDASGTTIFANTPMTDLLGIAPDQMTGFSIHDLWDRALSSVPEQRQPGMRSDYELPIIRSDGQTRWLRFHAVPRHNEAGDFTGSLLVCSDATGLRGDRSKGVDGRSDSYPDRTLTDPDLIREEDQPRIVSRPDLMKALANRGLTQREFDIVDRLIRGDRVPVIATTLFVSQSTIRNQLAAVFRKIGVHSQQELIAYVRRSWH